MKKVVVGIAVVAAIVAAVVMSSGASAYARVPPQPRQNDALTLFGPGSSIGVSARDLSGDEASRAKVSGGGGVFIERVADGTPASRAGLRTGDIVVEFDGERVRSARHFVRLVRETPPGRTVRASIVREGSRQSLDVTPENRRAEDFGLPPGFAQDLERSLQSIPRNFEFDFDFSAWPGSRRLGASLTPLTDQLATYFGVKDGVLVSSVAEGSAAAQAGLRAGDVITAIDGRTVNAPADATDALRSAPSGASLDIRVTRDKKELTLKAMVPERERQRPARLRSFRNRIPI